jgi:hypothetical protein
MQDNCVVEVKTPHFLSLGDKWELYSQLLLSSKKQFVLPTVQEGSAAFGVSLNKLKREVSSLPLKPEPRSAMVPKVCGTRGIRDQYPGDRRIRFCNS